MQMVGSKTPMSYTFEPSTFECNILIKKCCTFVSMKEENLRLADVEQYFFKKNKELLHKKKSMTKKLSHRRTKAIKDLYAADKKNFVENTFIYNQWHSSLLVPKVLRGNDLTAFSFDEIPVCESIVYQLKGLLAYRKDPKLSTDLGFCVHGFSCKSKEMQTSKSRVESGLDGSELILNRTESDLKNHSDNLESIEILSYSSTSTVSISHEQDKGIQTLNNSRASGSPGLYQGTDKAKSDGAGSFENGRNSLDDMGGVEKVCQNELWPDQYKTPLKLFNHSELLPSLNSNDFPDSPNTFSQTSASHLPNLDTFSSCINFSPLSQTATSESNDSLRMEFDQVQEYDINQRSDILMDQASDLCFNQEFNIPHVIYKGSDLSILQSSDIWSNQGFDVSNNSSSDLFMKEGCDVPNYLNSDIFINQERDMPNYQSSDSFVNQVPNNQSAAVFINSNSDMSFNEQSDIYNDQLPNALIKQGSGICSNQGSDIPINQNSDIFIDYGSVTPFNQSSNLLIDQGSNMPYNQSSNLFVNQGCDVSSIQGTVQSSGIPDDLSDLNMEELFASTSESIFAASHQDLNISMYLNGI